VLKAWDETHSTEDEALSNLITDVARVFVG
jgi:hypothetical protein